MVRSHNWNGAIASSIKQAQLNCFGEFFEGGVEWDAQDFRSNGPGVGARLATAVLCGGELSLLCNMKKALRRFEEG